LTTQSTASTSVVLAAVVVGAGLALGGYFVGDGLYAARASERYVTVKGLAEREVPANLAMWPLVFTTAADDLDALQAEVDANVERIEGFLRPEFAPEELTLSVPRITDNWAQSSAGMRPAFRYAAEVTLTLRTSKVGAVLAAMARSGELVKAGVPLIRSYEYQPEFLFTDLERIKPEMIAEATRDARRAAEQFAQDSASAVGAIRNAQQGYFSIDDRDRFSPEHKKVRVVTTVQYFLVDD